MEREARSAVNGDEDLEIALRPKATAAATLWEFSSRSATAASAEPVYVRLTWSMLITGVSEYGTAS